MELSIISPGLLKIRKAFLAEGMDVRIVGGAVRDILLGREPKDIDLATNAFPDEQLAIYEKHGIRYLPTGVQHGTYTALVDDVGYEITSLRTESDHDGRYATMNFTRDWEEDLSRRDLTMNAMSMDFEGKIFDPFNGADDLRNGLVKFVGDPAERIKEDYLRILRYYRFMARFRSNPCEVAENAIARHCLGLMSISAERVWVELKGILMGPGAIDTLKVMQKSNVLLALKLPMVGPGTHAQFLYATSPLSKFGLTFVQNHDILDHIDRLGLQLKMSKSEIQFLKDFKSVMTYSPQHWFYEAIVEGMDVKPLAEAARVQGEPFVATLLEGPLPKFHITGKDLIAAGHKPGPEMGTILNSMKRDWFNAGCK